MSILSLKFTAYSPQLCTIKSRAPRFIQCVFRSGDQSNHSRTLVFSSQTSLTFNFFLSQKNGKLCEPCPVGSRTPYSREIDRHIDHYIPSQSLIFTHSVKPILYYAMKRIVLVDNFGTISIHSHNPFSLVLFNQSATFGSIFGIRYSYTVIIEYCRCNYDHFLFMYIFFR